VPLHRSGQFRRQLKSLLPQVFYVYDNKSKMILAIVVVTRCTYSRDSSQVVWTIGQGVQLAAPFPITKDDRNYLSTIFKVTEDCASRLCSAATAAGGPVMYHLGDYARNVWRVWCFDPDEARRIVDMLETLPEQLQFTTKASTTRLLGITPSPHSVDAPINAEEDASGALGSEHARHCQPTIGSLALPAKPIEAAARQGINNLTMRSYWRGSVRTRYAPERILACLRLASNLKAPSALAEAVSDAADVLFGDSTSDLAREVREGQHALPKVAVLRRARVKLDIFSIMFERRLWLHFEYRRYLYLDASPQLGYNFLCGREDRIGIPRDEMLNSHFRSAYDINSNFETRILPVSTLGLGRATLAHKTTAAANIYLMESASDAEFHAKRAELRGAIADQGTEKGIVDEPVTIIPRFENAFSPTDTRSFLFPHALSMHGHLHILYNALQEAVESLPSAATYMEQLRAMEGFLSNKGLRRKFQASCVNGQACHRLFDHYPTVHCDWRWEFLSSALDILTPLFPHIKEHFNPKKLLEGEGGVLQRALVSEIIQVLETELFPVYSEMLRVVGKTVESYAKKLELCWCHAEFTRTQPARKRKAKRMLAHGGRDTCVWKGRMGPWWVANGIAELMDDIENCSSQHLQKLLATSSEHVRGIVLEEHILLKQRLREILTQKMRVWKTIPWLALGVFSCCCGGDLDTSKKVLQECFNQYAAAPHHRQHRVSRILFHPDSACRTDLDTFMLSGKNLQEFPHAFGKLQEYALVPLVERGVEMLHALIKRIGHTVQRVSPQYVCARMREKRNLDVLASNAEFHTMCVQGWSSTKLLDNVLALRFSKAQLNAMKPLDKIQAVYQCGESNEFQDTAKARQLREEWRTMTAYTRGVAPQLHDEWKKCVQYFKSRLRQGRFYSVDKDIYAGCESMSGFADYKGRPVKSALAAAQGKLPEFEWSSLASQVIFQVVNAHPERRTTLIHDMSTTVPTTITVCICHVLIVASSRGGVAIVHNDNSSPIALDLRGFVLDMQKTFSSLYAWEAIGKRSLLRPLACGQPGFAGESSLVSCDSGSMALPATGDMAKIPVVFDGIALACSVVALSKLELAGAATESSGHSVPVARLHGVHKDTLDKLATHGTISLTEDEFGETCASMHRSATGWTLAVCLGRPLLLCQTMSDEPVLRQSKLELLCALVQDGWQHCAEPPAAWLPGKPKLFNAAMKMPLSYFAALADYTSVFAKGVSSIAHGASNLYYRALLLLEGDRLQKVIADILGRPATDVAFVEDDAHTGDVDHLLDQLGESCPGQQASDNIPDMQLGFENGELCPTVVLFQGWTRCVVDAGPGTPAVKVYFDHYTSGLRQRGFVECGVHTCRRYRYITGTQAEFCAEMYVWHRHGSDPGVDSRWTHLEFVPTPAEVQDVMKRLRLTPF